MMTYSIRVTSLKTTTKTCIAWCIFSHCESVRLEVILVKWEAYICRRIHKHWAIVVLVQDFNGDGCGGCEDGFCEGVSHCHNQCDPLEHLPIQLHLCKRKSRYKISQQMESVRLCKEESFQEVKN